MKYKAPYYHYIDWFDFNEYNPNVIIHRKCNHIVNKLRLKKWKEIKQLLLHTISHIIFYFHIWESSNFESEFPRFWGYLRCCHTKVTYKPIEKNKWISPYLGKFVINSKIYINSKGHLYDLSDKSEVWLPLQTVNTWISESDLWIMNQYITN